MFVLIYLIEKRLIFVRQINKYIQKRTSLYQFLFKITTKQQQHNERTLNNISSEIDRCR